MAKSKVVGSGENLDSIAWTNTAAGGRIRADLNGERHLTRVEGWTPGQVSSGQELLRVDRLCELATYDRRLFLGRDRGREDRVIDPDVRYRHIGRAERGSSRTVPCDDEHRARVSRCHPESN
jgi:hypothetical protein